jgi:CheY-like chemotaxis protein
MRRLKQSERYKHVPIIAVTAGSLGQAHEAFDVGVSRYLLKPIEPAIFIREVNSCLAGEGKAVPPPSCSPAKHVAERATILAVDDRRANLELMVTLLGPIGYRVIMAGGVEEALALARQAHPDLIITDVHMADGSGFDLIRQLQADVNLSRIPWLVTSATYLGMDERAQQFNLNGSNFILQPWDPRILIAKVQQRLPAAKLPMESRGASAN